MSRNKTVKASRLKQAKAPSPIEPARFDDFVVTSLQALADGNATAHEQKKALEWIIKVLVFKGEEMAEMEIVYHDLLLKR